MREIEFRGKIKEKPKQWIYGSYFEGLEIEHSIGQQQEVKGIIFYFQNTDWDLPRPIKGIEVLKNTVGQYTGLKDKNGKKIFEGDIVKFTEFYNWNGKERHTGVVCWRDCCYWINSSAVFELKDIHTQDHEFEIIGNIHELLKEAINE